MHGYHQMVGLHPTVFIHPDSYHLFDAYVRAIRNGLEFRTRAQDVRRDGTIFDVEVVDAVSCIRDNSHSWASSAT